MCGICGQINFDVERPIEEAVIRDMCFAMIHRGPDDEGLFFDGHIGLGIRRLSIIDVSTGHQPVFNEDQSVCLVFNGEIYNYLELRESLQARGHVFSSQSDTEVIVHLYEEEGENCVQKLNGMFAFAIWDKRKNALFLVRDRFGIKPLVYYLDRDRLVFASEIQALLTDGSIPREIDWEALHNYFSFYYITAPLTIFRSIRKIPPGHMLVCIDGRVTLKEYWRLEYVESLFQEDESRYSERIQELLKDAVRLQLRSDVPLGVFLSGGLDSGGIVAMASSLLNQPVKTFSLGFKEKSYDELEEARLVAKTYRTDHHEFVMGASDFNEILPEVVTLFGEPYADWSSIPNYLVAKKAKEDVTVILRGDGGDEVFGGYPTYVAYKLARLYRRVPRVVREQVVTRAVNALPVSSARVSFDYKAKRFVRGANYSPEVAHYLWKVIFDEDEKRRLYTPDLIQETEGFDSFSVLQNHLDRLNGVSMLNRFLYLDLRVFLEGCSLPTSDITAMANSVEARVPFLDHRLVEWAACLPSSLKVRGITTKYIFRKAMAPYLPSRVVKGAKKGFHVPCAQWIKNESRDLILDILSKTNVQQVGFLNYSYVDNLIQQHLTGRQDNYRCIACLASFMLWYNQYIKT
jgi:asparagine synthase (glutamine-hydrolysing)